MQQNKKNMVVNMDLRQRLKLKKEIYFMKYIIKKPLAIIGGYVWHLVSNPLLWLILEFLILIRFLFRNFFNELIVNYDFSLTFDSRITLIGMFIFLTIVYIFYKSQAFQEEYKSEEAEKLKAELGCEEKEVLK